ncbi:histidine kinase [Minwuia thermotolerans]|uniref:Histidine kinase n=2 Tax=Minwuia thermotolerans TaxID=2056226 RepID=A0A2M9G505_9PROT|nr:histidine kinase [Minwuia thermotolerans]
MPRRLPSFDGAMTEPADTFAFGAGADRDWRTAVSACLDQLEASGAAGCRLGFVYLTDHFSAHASDILTVLRGRTGIDDWVGTTGIGVVAGRRQLFDEPGVAAMAMAAPRAHYRLLRRAEDDIEGIEPWFGVLHADARAPDLPEGVAELAERLGGYWVGGIAASRAAWPMIARGLADTPLSGVALSADIGVRTALSQGCSPIGPPREINRAEKNVVVELDGQPAFEVFREEAGEVLARNLERVPGFIFAGLPVSGADSGDYLVRDITGLDPQHGLVAVAEEVEVGGRLMFCRRDGASAAEDMTRMLDKLERSLDGRRPRGGLYYSCLGRGPNMFDADRTELDMIAERFGDFPLTGFFCNGEISNARLYTYTGVLSLFM